MGVMASEEFENYEISLQRGDRLYFYSDGITEAANKNEKMLDIPGLIALLEGVRARRLDDGIPELVASLKRWCDPVPLADDLSVLALEFGDDGKPAS